MPTSDVPGFVDRKTASQVYNRSLRSLSRDFDRAKAANDATVLENFRLQTDDGTIREAADVSSELISRLKKIDKVNPTWYVRASWLEKTYGQRSDLGTSGDTNAGLKNSRSRGYRSQETIDSEPIAVLRERIRSLEEQKRSLEEDKKQLLDELKIKNKQITDGNELTQQLHHLMANLQQRLLPAGGAQRPAPATGDTAPVRDIVVTPTGEPQRTEKGSAASAKTDSAAKRKSVAKHAKPASAKTTTPKKPAAHTLKDILLRPLW